MKSLERRFQNIAKRNPNFSSYLCFAKAIEGQQFNKKTIRFWFQRLVDKDDYITKEKGSLLKHLDSL
ncbi:MAG: hypothetical protein PHR47_00540 [Candidatus Pacebacteria bacterium]|nr:hypothetical protein [Candidatus Paceibacterota bacterium]